MQFMYLDQFPLQLSILCKYGMVLSLGGKEETGRRVALREGTENRWAVTTPQQTVKECWVGGWSQRTLLYVCGQKAQQWSLCFGQFLAVNVLWYLKVEQLSLGHQ